MAIVKQHRRGTTDAHESFVGASGELTWDTTKFTWIGHDGSTSGGYPMLAAHRNLAGLTNKGTARSNLGLGSAAVEDDTRYAHRSNNLSDLDSASTARSNLSVYTQSKFSDQTLDADFNLLQQNGTKAALVPGSSTDPGLAFNTWRTPSSARGDNRPTWVEVECEVATDGTNSGSATVEVDESGGTTVDYRLSVAYVNDLWSSSDSRVDDSTTCLIPNGASYRIRNNQNPEGTNTIREHREFVI